MAGTNRPRKPGRHGHRGQDLCGKDFERADIRGVDFANARLAGARFDHARAGIRPLVAAGLFAAALLLAILSGLVIGFAGAIGPFLVGLPAEEFSAFQQQVLPWIGVILLGALMLILYRRGIGLTLGIFALAVAFLVALVAILFPSAEVGATTLLMMLLIGGGLAGVVGLAAAWILLHDLASARTAWVALVAAAIATVPGVGEGVFGLITRPDSAVSDVSPLALLVAGALTMLLLAVSIRIGHRAVAHDERYSLMRALIIGLLTRAGTSFRGADLSGADFTGASLPHTDLRGARLIRTNFSQATDLDRAHTEGTYLAHPSVAAMLTGRSAGGESFDHLDLQGINLDGVGLEGASFRDANLSRATLRAADLSHVNLGYAQLHDADLTDARLTGAYIEGWGISTNTRFDGIDCDFIYTRLPTEQDPDPWRKPDNRSETFREGDFVDFIAPIVKTLDLYRQQAIDPRAVGRAYKTLDLFHHQGVDPTAAAVALAQLAERHPGAGLELVAVEGHGMDKVRVEATVAAGVDRSALSQEYGAIYDEVRRLPHPRLEALLAEITEKDDRIRSLEEMVSTALKTEKFYVETYIDLGGPVIAPVKCLFLAADPNGMPRLSLDREIREITAKIRASEYRDALQLVSEWAVRPDDLLQALNVHKPQIVHFSGHGTETGEIVLVDDAGAPQPVSAAALGAVFATLKDNVRLVILNACYAEHQARAITEVIDCAVGMRAEISDASAIAFIASFYRALGFGRSIQQAFDQGIAALMLVGTAEESIPQLLVRESVHPESIVLVRPDASAAAKLSVPAG